MKKLLFLFVSVSLILSATNIPVTIIGTTSTQAAIQYTATTLAACTVTATDISPISAMDTGETTLKDLNSSLFTGANSDLSRTFANGFRWPTLLSSGNLKRTVIISGHNEIKLAVNNKWYSTASQVNGIISGTVSCNGGADTGTFTAQLKNIPQGFNYPEFIIPVLNAPMGIPQPTIDWGDRTKKYIDPISGVVIRRMAAGDDNFDDTNPTLGSTSSFYVGYTNCCLDVAGTSQWTTPNNLITNKAASTLSTTTALSTTGCTAGPGCTPLFAPIIAGPPTTEFFTDLLVIPYGHGSGGTTVEWCLSFDSGQTCSVYTPQVTALSTSDQVYSTLPASTPSSHFSGWGGMKVPFGNYDMYNQISANTGAWTISCMGSVCNIDQNNIYPGLNLDRKSGSKFWLNACSVGANSTLTVSSVINTNQLTVQESALNLQNCSYTDLSFGIRATMIAGAQANISFQMQGWVARSNFSPTTGSWYPTARTKVTDIATDCAGNSQSPNLKGYLSYNYLLQDNGIICRQSNGLYQSTDPGGEFATQAFLYTTNKAFVMKGVSPNYHVYNVVHRNNNYTEIASDPSHTNTDSYTYTNIDATNPIGPQIQSAGGTVATALNTGLFPAMGIDQLFDDGAGGTITQYRSTVNPGAIDSMCLLAWADTPTNTLLSALAVYGSYPFNSGACHFGPDGGAAQSKISALASSNQIAPMFFNTTISLGGPFWSHITSIHQHDAVYKTWSFSISAATAGSPVIITSTNNDILAGSYSTPNGARMNGTLGIPITCSGATFSWTPLNGSFYAILVGDNNGLKLYNDPISTAPTNFGSGSLTGTVTCTIAPPIYSLHITSVTNNGGNARINIDKGTYYTAFYPSAQDVWANEDPIVFGTTLTNNTQYYAKKVVTGSIDIYTDSALTTPASYASISGFSGSYVTYSETCPDPSTYTLPGPLYTDTGFGSVGSPKKRCLIFRLGNEPENDYPATNEHTKYPPCNGSGTPDTSCISASSEFADPKKSMLHAIHIGDGFGDVVTFPSQDPLEVFYVIKVDRTAGENQIDVTTVRNYGDDPNYSWRGSSNGISHQYGMNHFIGWGLVQEAVVPGGIVSMNSPTQYAVPAFGFSGAHYDIVSGSTANTITAANPYQPGLPDDAVNVTTSQFSTSFNALHNSIPNWNSGTAYPNPSGISQSYPSKRVIPSQAQTSELPWKSDWMALNPSIGNGENNGDTIGWTRTLTNIRGSTYDATNLTSVVWKITPPTGSSINIKLAPVLVQNLPHNYYQDKSGPNSLITDSDLGKFCIAYVAGECRPNSAQWDIFFAGNGFFNWPSCRTNEMTLGTPCAFGLWPGAGWAVQIRMTPVDQDGTGVRRLTKFFLEPPNHYSFSNWSASPDGKWGFFTANPLWQRPRKGEYSGSHLFVMQLPPWENTTTPNTGTYINTPISVGGNSGDVVRIAFGYAENGDPNNLYCTTRQEMCWTSSTASASNPFLFSSETQHKTTCSSGCTIPVPLIAGRIAYYAIERNGVRGPIQILIP